MSGSGEEVRGESPLCIRCQDVLLGAEGESNGYCAFCSQLQASEEPAVADAAHPSGLWRQGTLLVARKNAVFPDRCLKTNQPNAVFVRENFRWTPSNKLQIVIAIVVCGLLGILISFILVHATAKKMTLHVPLGDEVRALYRRTVLSYMIAAALVCIFFPLGFSAENWIIAMVGAVALLALSVLANYKIPLLFVEKIEADCVYIKGVCPEFLSELPYFHARHLRRS